MTCNLADVLQLSRPTPLHSSPVSAVCDRAAKHTSEHLNEKQKTTILRQNTTL